METHANMVISKQKEDFLRALKRHNGNVSRACEDSNCIRRTYYGWYKNDKAFADVVESIRESMIDRAESVLFQKIDEGSLEAAKFALERIGKSRGYTIKQESSVEGNINLPVVVQIVKPQEEDSKN